LYTKIILFFIYEKNIQLSMYSTVLLDNKVPVKIDINNLKRLHEREKLSYLKNKRLPK